MSEIVSNEELIFSNMLEIQALIKILTKKGITTEDEILDEVKKLKVEMEEKIKKMSKENWWKSVVIRKARNEREDG